MFSLKHFQAFKTTIICSFVFNKTVSGAAMSVSPGVTKCPLAFLIFAVRSLARALAK